MKCIVVASIIVAAVSLRLATAQFNGQPPRVGSCVESGYGSQCCPPGGNCRATGANSNCFCDARCHIDVDCCEDVHCVSGIV